MTITPSSAANELLRRRKARNNLSNYINYTNELYKTSIFSEIICATIDLFLAQVQAGTRPILVLQAPPQHGKSEIVSRRLPAYIMGKFPNYRVACASYADTWAHSLAQDVRRILVTPEHLKLFPPPIEKPKYNVDRMGEFNNLNGKGGYLAVGAGSGLTGRPVDIGIIDDIIKNQEESLSEVTKTSHWNWYQTVFTTRMSECSGQIIMATSWAEDDLPSRIIEHFRGDSRLIVLRFPAINDPSETGFNKDLPLGALCPELHSLEKLLETKALFSDYWWAALYQQLPRAIGGNVFKEQYINYYLPKELPAKFDKKIISVDCTFKDTDGSDYVVAQVWGKKGANGYLLDQIRARMSFTKTVDEVVNLYKKWPGVYEVLIEEKANGAAVIEVIKKEIPGVIPIIPTESKLARAHAVTSYWEAGNIYLPHEDIVKWVIPLVAELLSFPNAAHDDQVDSLTQALRRLYPLFLGLKISQETINEALRKG
jgi:predicted phage terminase large subunit-like protein